MYGKSSSLSGCSPSDAERITRINDDARGRAKRKLIESCRGTYRGALFQSSPEQTKRVFDAKRELEKYYDGKREGVSKKREEGKNFHTFPH